MTQFKFMLERLMNLLNSDVGPDLAPGPESRVSGSFGGRHVRHSLRTDSQARQGYELWVAARSVAGALFAVLIYQATWQIWGYTNPDFVKFMRRYNRRPDAAEKQVMRGPLLDRRGMVLAAPVIGDVWGRPLSILGAAGGPPLGYYHSTYGITAVERVCDPTLSGYAIDKRDREALGKMLFTQRAAEERP